MVVNSWLFQGNPLYYDMDRALRQRDVLPWTVTRYRDDIMVGDRVVLWMAGPAGGICAIGTISAAPRPYNYDDRPTRAYFRAFDPTRDVFFAEMALSRKLHPPIPRNLIRQHPTLGRLGVLTFPPGTNYRVTPEQWGAILHLVDRLA
jgi:hypothetical protein